MKKLFLLMAAMVVSVEMLAVPAKRVVRTVVQSDGSLLSIQLVGDESFHYYSTLDGCPVMEGPDGFYYYSTMDRGAFLSSRILAHNEGVRTLSEQIYLDSTLPYVHSATAELWSERLSIRNLHREERNTKMRSMFRTNRIKSRTHTTEVSHKKGLVILVNYKDKKMRSSTVNADFNDMFNQEGYTKNKHIGSVRDYFMDQSYGQLVINFDVVGPYDLSQNMEYYGKNKSNGDDMYAAKMVAEACQKADADVNFADYDWDGDGEVDQVYVIYAGYGEASGAPSNTIWPHEWQLSAGKASGDGPGALTLDGVKVDTYACSNELTGTTGSMMDGIGTACHEFSHCLGLPDFYDTSGKNFGMNVWSLMDYGCYNGPSGYDGNVPCAYTAYERWFSGWIDLEVLDAGCEVKGMRAITDSQDAYAIINDGNKNEYYVLTNIQKKSWNTYAKGHGLLIQHIDYNANVWANNTVNNTSSRQRCTIFPADNSLSTSSLAGDPYPGTKNNSSLTNNSTPASTLYNTNSDGSTYMNKPLEDITEVNGLISFKFNGGHQFGTPTALAATDITSTGFTANWTAVEDAVSYNLLLKEYIKGSFDLILSENFKGLSSLANNEDITNNLDSYLSTPGWTGVQLTSTGKTAIKLGTNQVIGSLTSPALPPINNGAITIYLLARPYAYPLSTTGYINVTYGNQTERLTLDSKAKTISFIAGRDGDKVTFSTTDTGDKRILIYNIAIFDGEVSQEDIESYLSENAVRSRITSQNTFTGITGTSYEFKNLSGDKYTYWVQAVSADGELSKWSNSIEVVLEGTGIEDLTFEMEEDIQVYTMDGKCLGTWRADFPKGIYILKQGKKAVLIRN